MLQGQIPAAARLGKIVEKEGYGAFYPSIAVWTAYLNQSQERFPYLIVQGSVNML